MKQRIPCPHCGHQVRIAPWQYGQQCACPKCQGTLDVPDLSSAEKLTADAQRLGPREAATPGPTPATRPAPASSPPKPPASSTPAPQEIAPELQLPLPEIVEDSTSDAKSAAELEWLNQELDRLSGAKLSNPPPAQAAPPAAAPPAQPNRAKPAATKAGRSQPTPSPLKPGVQSAPTAPNRPRADQPTGAAPTSLPEDLGLEVNAAKAARPAEPSYQPNDPVPIVCTLCSTRFYAKFSEVGQVKSCPDCYVDNVVKPPTKPPVKQSPARQAVENDDGSLRLSPADDLPRYEPLTRGEISDGELTHLRAPGAKATPRGHPAQPAKVLRLQCGRCKAILLVPEKLADKEISCPECHTMLRRRKTES